MKNTIKTIAIGSLALLTMQAPTFAQETGRGDTVLTRHAFNDGVSTVDALNIDADIRVQGNIFMQNGSSGDIATLTLSELDAAAVSIEKRVRISGETHVGDEARISEGNTHLTGDMGSVTIEQNYTRTGKVQLAQRASLSVGNVMVTR